MYLPKEILKEVGSYLTLSEQGSCIRVCYDWYEPFLELLYTKVHIQSRNQFRLFYQSIQHSCHINNPLGHLVKELSFDRTEHGSVGLTRDELESLPDYFENLTRLDFDPKIWRYMRYSAKLTGMKHLRRLPTLDRKEIFQPLLEDISHSLLSQLSYLSISGEAATYLLNSKFTTSVWSRIPKLETLIIKGTNHTPFNIKMIMALAAHLPFLKHLTLSCVTLPLSEKDLNSTTTFPLFASAQSLILDDVYIKHWRMITLLSLAFYHVELLDFDVTFDWLYGENVTIELYEQSMDAFMGFAQLCIFLKKVIFRKMKTSVFPFPYDAFFMEIADIHQDHVAIEMTEYAWWSTIDPTPSFRAVTAQTGLLSKADLKWSWTGKKLDTALFKSLRNCHYLTELALDCDVSLKNGLRLDLLLDSCKALKVLTVSNTLVTTSRTVDKTIKARYKTLYTLKLKDVILGDQLMDFVAETCIHLDHLLIKNCVQEKPKRSSFVVIRMPEHQFKLIQIDSIHLNPGGNTGKCEAHMTILSIYESMRYKNQIERKKRNTTQQGKTATPEMWRFYHVHKLASNNSKQLGRLSTEEAAMVANFEMTEKKWKAVRQASKRKSYVEKSLWEKDIQFGAVLLLCKSVDQLVFNELKV